jgi:hypothetical protein
MFAEPMSRWKKVYKRRERYFPISDYVKHVGPPGEGSNNNSNRNILLLTDDQSAIDEALALHHNYFWYYINRTRHYGATAGFNQHIPSQDPMLEVIIIY